MENEHAALQAPRQERPAPGVQVRGIRRRSHVRPPSEALSSRMVRNEECRIAEPVVPPSWAMRGLMRYRLRTPGRTAMALLAMVWSAPLLFAGQNPTADSKPWTMPRTPWGDPDLQGTWSNWDRTPFQ